ncbi:CopG family transcripitonal regulator [Cupriavidus taiwanensis]|nr:CopG family transcripitonal regulator [Cupriavidus taiwanensis]
MYTMIIQLSCNDTQEHMETKTARLTVLIDPVKKKAFEALCAAQDQTPSQVVRQLIRDYLQQHEVDYATRPKAPSLVEDVGDAP